MTLQDVVPWGRNLQENKSMFALDDKELHSKILGWADGPSSFNAELTQKGGHVVSIDPVYRFSAEDITRRIEETAETVMGEVASHKDDFIWKTISDIDTLRTIRLSAMQKFLDDFDQGRQEQRYLIASLPELPFKEQQFDLVLCSHFLFLYGEHLDLSFHIASVKAMCLVGREVRLFPLLDLKGNRSAYLALIDVLRQEGHTCHIEHVEYEFQKGGDEMLRVERAKDKGTVA